VAVLFPPSFDSDDEIAEVDWLFDAQFGKGETKSLRPVRMNVWALAMANMTGIVTHDHISALKYG
jgi:hypothetical protein